MSAEALKLVGASEAELADPRVAQALARLDGNEHDATAAQVLCASVPPPPPQDIPVAPDRHGLAKYGVALRRKTNIHDLFIQRILSFGLPPTPKWIADFHANPKTAGADVPAKMIPESYMPSVFIFILGAPFAQVEDALALGEERGFYAFFEDVDAWIASTGIPTDKTEQVWADIMKSLQFLEAVSAESGTGVSPVSGSGAAPTVKKSARRGSSRTTR